MASTTTPTPIPDNYETEVYSSTTYTLPAPTPFRRRTVVLAVIFIGILATGAAVLLSRGASTASVAIWRTQMLTALAARDYTNIDYFGERLLTADPTNPEAYQALLWSQLMQDRTTAAAVLIHNYLAASGGVVGYTLDTVAQVADARQIHAAIDATTILISEIEAGTGFAARSQQVSRNSAGRLQDTGIYNAYSARGKLYARLNEFEEAEADFRAAVDALPTFFFGYEQLMRFQFAQGDDTGAVETLTQGQRRGALSLMFYVRVAEDFYFHGSPSSWVHTLLDLSHDYDDIPYYGWFVEGCVHRSTGDMLAARAAMQTWKSLRPNDPLTVEALLAECSNPESKLFWHIDPLFQSSPNYYGLEE